MNARLPDFPLGKVSGFILPPWFLCAIPISFQRALTVVFTMLAVANEAMLLQVTPICDLILDIQSLLLKTYTAPSLLHKHLKQEREFIWLSDDNSGVSQNQPCFSKSASLHNGFCYCATSLQTLTWVWKEAFLLPFWRQKFRITHTVCL